MWQSLSTKGTMKIKDYWRAGGSVGGLLVARLVTGYWLLWLQHTCPRPRILLHCTGPRTSAGQLQWTLSVFPLLLWIINIIMTNIKQATTSTHHPPPTPLIVWGIVWFVILCWLTCPIKCLSLTSTQLNVICYETLPLLIMNYCTLDQTFCMCQSALVSEPRVRIWTV